MTDVIVRLVNLPPSIKGLTSPSPDGVHNVFLNARHSRECNLETYLHELQHIQNDDFTSVETVEQIEKGVYSDGFN